MKTFISSLLFFCSIIAPLHADDSASDWISDWGSKASKAVEEYVDPADIDKAKKMAEEIGTASSDMLGQLFEQFLDSEIKLPRGQSDLTEIPSVELIDDVAPADDERRIIKADLTDKKVLRRTLEQEFILNKSLRLDIEFQCKSSAKKKHILKSIHHFFSNTFILQSLRIYDTPAGITIDAKLDPCIYLARAYQGKYPIEQLNASEREALQILKRKLPQIIAGKSTEYDKALAVNDWIIKHVYYEKKDRHQMGDQGLVKGYFVCSGYARLYSTMMEALGIPCVVIVENGHAWNMILIDGKWSHVDVTWNDGGKQSLHTYFCLNHEDMNKVHNRLRRLYHILPDSKDSTMSYIYKYYTHVGSVSELRKVIETERPNKHNQILIYFDRKMSKSTFAKNAYKSKNKYMTLTNWFYEADMQKTAILYFKEKDDTSSD